MKGGIATLVPALLLLSLLVASPPSLADSTDTPTTTDSDNTASGDTGAANTDTGSAPGSAASDTPVPTGTSLVVPTPVTSVSENSTSAESAPQAPADVPANEPVPTAALPDPSLAPTAGSEATPTVTAPATDSGTPSPADTSVTAPVPDPTVPSPISTPAALTVDAPTDARMATVPDSVMVPAVIISELQIAGDGANDDFVELFNPGNDRVSLKGFELRRKTKGDTTATGSLFHAFSDTDGIPAKGYFLWANKDGGADFITLADAVSANKTSPALTADNSLALLGPDKTILDSVTWGSGHSKPFSPTVAANPDKNTSLVRDSETLAWSISDCPTPTNSKGATVGTAPACDSPTPNPPIGTIIINELYPNPNTGESEWVELMNSSDIDVSLSGWKLKDASTGAGFTFPSGTVVRADGFLVIGAETSKITLNNTGTESLTLLFPDGSVADSFMYDGTERGASYARNDTGIFLLTHLPTPGGPNAFDPIPVEEPLPPIGTVRINELFPNPATKGEPDEWIELRNVGSDEVSLVGWQLKSGAGTFRWTAGLDASLRTIPANGFLVLPRSLTKLALRNSDGNVTLLAPDGTTLMDTVSYASTTEGNSYGYFVPGRYRWSRTLTPGADNVFGTEPAVRKSDIPKKGYANTLIPFSATGNKRNMRFVWDFGDGHKSYLEGPSHRYAKTGTYEGTLTLRDGIEETVKFFTIRIGKYPNRDLHLTGLCPNPTGTDTGSEWIRIRNDDTKRIDLSGWIIATGSDTEKLVNHSMLSKRFIAPGEEIVLTHDDSKFTLPNRQAVIELRRPDGKTMQTISYQTEKDIEEDAVYTDTGDGWAWILPGSDTETFVPDTTAPNGSETETYEPGVTTNPDSDRLSFGEFVSLGTPYDPALPDSLPRVLGASDERLQGNALPSESLLDALFRLLNGLATGTI